VCPSLREHSWGPASFTATTVTLASIGTATAISDYTAFSSAVDEYRVVSWGIRIYSTDAPLNQAGEIAVITLPEEPPTYSGATLADTGSLFENISRFPVAGANVHWISKPVGVAWKEYRNVNLYPSYESVLLVVRGAAGGQTFTVETFMNLEAQPKLASLTAVISTKAADHHPTALAAGVNVHNKHRGAHNAPTKTVSRGLWGMLRDTALDLAGSAIPYVGGLVSSAAKSYFGSRGRQRLPAIADQIMEVD
jgi:hypothetical protein